jgi:hypothetical protein
VCQDGGTSPTAPTWAAPARIASSLSGPLLKLAKLTSPESFSYSPDSFTILATLLASSAKTIFVPGGTLVGGDGFSANAAVTTQTEKSAARPTFVTACVEFRQKLIQTSVTG